MGYRKKAREEREQQKLARKRKNRFLGIGLSATAFVAIVGGVAVSKLSCNENQYTPPTANVITIAPEKWEDHMLEYPILLETLVRFSPTYRRIGLESQKSETLEVGNKISILNKSGKYRDFNMMNLGGLCNTTPDSMKVTLDALMAIYSDQNGINDCAKDIDRLRQMDDDNIFYSALNMGYFQTRSTYSTVKYDIDSYAPNLVEILKSGKGDCVTHSASTFLNTLGILQAMKKDKLIQRLRIVNGFRKNSNTDSGHVWIEAYVHNKWTSMECNRIEENALLGTRYEPGKDYLQNIIIPSNIASNHVKIIGFRYITEATKPGYALEIYVLPEAVKNEMIQNGWKPRK